MADANHTPPAAAPCDSQPTEEVTTRLEYLAALLRCHVDNLGKALDTIGDIP
jgi:hypothetical protein